MSSFANKKKIIPSSEFLSLEVDETNEDLIPHSDDPVKDVAKIYWKIDSTGQAKAKPMPTSDDEDNKIYLNEDKDFYTNIPGAKESVKIVKYHMDPQGKEFIDLMVAL